MKDKQYLSLLKYFPITICIILIVCYLGSGKEISVQTILNCTPNNLFVAMLIILLFYAIKSITVIIPIIILEVATALIFTTIPALLINSLGVLIGYIITYFIGFFSGSDIIEKLTKKYPLLENLVKKQNKNSFFTCFFLRTLCFLPGDAVSMCLGAVKPPFLTYIVASMLGSLPGTILATLFGSSITEPASPMFWISIVLMALYSGSSLLIYHIFLRKKPAS